MSFKNCDVVMLSTNEKALTGMDIVGNGKILYLVNSNLDFDLVCYWIDNNLYKKQNLYILSDEEIKEGDWFLMNGCIIRQCKSTNKKQHTIPTVVDTIGGIHHVSICKKIIATTDKLNMHPNVADSYRSGNCVPQPPQSFIEKFVEEYNKGNIITEVMVEYEEIEEYIPPRGCFEGDFYQGTGKFKLKINSDNTINCLIKPTKDSWSRDEVVELLRSRESHIDCHTHSKQFIDKQDYRELDEWIDENL